MTETFSESLEGELVVLRRMTTNSIPEAYLSYLGDPEVVHYLQARFTDHTPETIKTFVAGFDHNDSFLFGVHDRESGRFIGTGTLRVNPVHRYSNLGYMLGDKKYWRGGYALDICRTLMDFAFFERHVRKIFEATTANHTASNFNFKRLGFTLEAKIPDLYWGEGKYQAATYWSMNATTWAKIRGRPAPSIPTPDRD